jgi:hypothetical protein
VLRLKGNRFFKAKRFKEALEKYMGSLKEKPYEVNTLSNVCMAHLKKCEYEDAVEFADRAIFLDRHCVKVCVCLLFVVWVEWSLPTEPSSWTGTASRR